MLNNTNHYIPRGSWDLEFLKNKIKDMREDFSDVFVVADFDKTLTTGDSFTIWNMLAKSGIVGEDYTSIMSDLYKYYRPFEVSTEISFEEKNEKMQDWWIKSLQLLTEHWVNKSSIDGLVIKYINWRQWVADFLNITRQLNIPIIIVSAWIGNFIEEFFLLHGIDMSNISIESNFLLYDDNWVVSGIDKSHIIHTFNKNNHILNDYSKGLVWNRKKALVLWDSSSDIQMIDLFDVNNHLSIWLLTKDTNTEYFDNSGFDLVNLWHDFGLINSIFPL